MDNTSLVVNISNVSTPTPCLSPGIVQFRLSFYFVVYYIIFPIYFIVTTFGQTILIIAFSKQSKGEKAYIFQVYFTVSKLTETVVYFASIPARKWWSGMESKGVEWFQRNYALMWYSARISTSSVNWFITCSLLISVAMAADRVLALTVPFVYKNLNHKVYHKLVALTCLFLGVTTSLFDCFRFYLVSVGEDIYAVKVDQDYLVSKLGMGLANFRNALRILGLVSLIGLNIAMVLAFKKRSRKVGQMTNKGEEGGQKTKKSDRILLLLTVCQSVLTCIAMTPLSVYYTMVYSVTGFSSCTGSVMLVFVDASISISESLDCFVILAIDKKLRQMVRRWLKCGDQKENMVSTIPLTQHGQMSQAYSKMDKE